MSPRGKGIAMKLVSYRTGGQQCWGVVVEREGRLQLVDGTAHHLRALVRKMDAEEPPEHRGVGLGGLGPGVVGQLAAVAAADERRLLFEFRDLGRRDEARAAEVRGRWDARLEALPATDLCVVCKADRANW